VLPGGEGENGFPRADEFGPVARRRNQAVRAAIDFAGNKKALKTNLKSRAEAKAHLMGGGCLVIFPAGGVSTTPTMWSKRAIDADWKTFAARMISQARAPVAQCSSPPEQSPVSAGKPHQPDAASVAAVQGGHDKIGSEVRVRVGDIVPYDALASITDRTAFMQHLKDLTYALGVGVQSPPKPDVKRPRRAPKHGRSFQHVMG